MPEFDMHVQTFLMGKGDGIDSSAAKQPSWKPVYHPCDCDACNEKDKSCGCVCWRVTCGTFCILCVIGVECAWCVQNIPYWVCCCPKPDDAQ